MFLEHKPDKSTEYDEGEVEMITIVAYTFETKKSKGRQSDLMLNKWAIK